jgi:hypothetical protein
MEKRTMIATITLVMDFPTDLITAHEEGGHLGGEDDEANEDCPMCASYAEGYGSFRTLADWLAAVGATIREQHESIGEGEVYGSYVSTSVASAPA